MFTRYDAVNPNVHWPPCLLFNSSYRSPPWWPPWPCFPWLDAWRLTQGDMEIDFNRPRPWPVTSVVVSSFTGSWVGRRLQTCRSGARLRSGWRAP